MGTPDILGTSGTFSFYTTELFAFDGEDISGGEVYEVWAEDGVLDAKLYALDNPFKQEKEKLEASFTAYIDEDEPVVRVVIWKGDREDEEILAEVVLSQGEWSDWVPVEFEMIPGMTLNAMTRFYLKQVRPELELYASPLNIDPLNQEMPISHPASYAEDLAHATGRFYTQEMPEDTKALSGEIFSVDEFLAQTEIVQEQYERQFRHVLDRYEGGFLFYYFGNLDQVSHMMWRSMDPDHPVYDEEKDGPYAEVIPKLYERFDAIVGETLAKIDDDTLLIVMSDHGFTSWRRAFHLNTWLEENGYLTLKDANRRNAGFFTNVNWSETRAYGLGLNGLYINVEGRERDGIVPEDERQALMDEIGAKLLEVRDPSIDELAITRVYPREEYYRDRGYMNIGPDIQVGYAKRTRGSSESAMGEIGLDVFTDNDDWWSGDHCMDHTAVPGILVTNRPLKKKADRLKNLAASILAEYGIEDFPPRPSHPSEDDAGTANGGS
jgi:predicted AlkP superfamily phosphohydrolase/phosphomutase